MTIKIFHHNDIDGRCAAAIAARYYDQIPMTYEFIELDYKDRIPVVRIGLGDCVVIVDFSFDEFSMGEVLYRTKNIIWCDHHVTARDYKYGTEIKGYRDFSEKGLSGCECTWKYFFPELNTPLWVNLLGDYDAFRLYCQPKCFWFYEGLKLHDTSPETGVWWGLMDGSIQVDSIMEEGKIVIKYRDSYCLDIVKKYGYETEIDGYKALAVNLSHFGSAQFGNYFHEYPVCIAYIYDGNQYIVTIYSDLADYTSINVGEIAKKYGGGGHKGAAGFTTRCLPFKIRDEV